MSWNRINRVRVVVLNATYEPLNIIPMKKAILSIFEGKSTVLEVHPTYVLRSARSEMRVPTQIVLKKWVKAPPTHKIPAQLGGNNKNLHIRDRYICQYCNRHKKNLREGETLTRDHVLPRAKGGRDIWENVVTACSTCNNKKADKTLAEMGIKLPRRPYAPTVFEIWSKTLSKYYDTPEYEFESAS